MAENNNDRLSCFIVIVLVCAAIGYSIASGSNKQQVYQKGDMSKKGGSPTIRQEYYPTYQDDPDTSNDESNDQPVGFYGTETMEACNQNSGNCYDLDVDSDGENVERIYFPKGGWVDIDSSECEDGTCTATDENGTDWELEY